MEPQRKFIPGVVPQESPSGSSWWFAFQGERLLVQNGSSGVSLPCLGKFEETGLSPVRRHYLGSLDGKSCYTVEVTDGVAPAGDLSFQGLRQVYGRLDEDLFWIATRAIQILEWDKTHQYCGRCGILMDARENERAKECPQCGLLFFPRLAPAIIVLIERGDQVLLARSKRFATGMYSVLAGFVEPGESLEETVVREVREEVGLSIKNVAYFGSQPWPFPHSLMIGFTAHYAGGEISIDLSEIEDARWFTVENLPPIPGKISIARKLIDWFIAKQGKGTLSIGDENGNA